MSFVKDMLTYDFVGKPFSSFGKLAVGFVFVIPAGVAFVWGVYNPDNLAGVLGAATRRATVSVISETQPVGERILRTTYGEDETKNLKNVESDSTSNLPRNRVGDLP